MIFCAYIKNAREKKYATAKLFFVKEKLSCSYSYYQQVERGIKLPRAELAIEMIKKLNCDLKIGLFSWAETQMPDSNSKEVFSLLENSPTLNDYFHNNEESLLIDRPKLKLIQQNPLYWEAILLLNTSQDGLTSEAIADQFNLKVTKIKTILNNLYKYSLIEKAGNEDSPLYKTAANIHMPRDAEYDIGRKKNFTRSYQQFTKSKKRRFQSTLTVALSEDEAEEVARKCIQLTLLILSAESQAKAKKSIHKKKPYTLGLFWSQRIFGNNTNE